MCANVQENVPVLQKESVHRGIRQPAGHEHPEAKCGRPEQSKGYRTAL